MKSSQSNKVKVVKRRYYSKKQAKWVTKEYTYKASQLRSRKTYIINSKGKVNQSALKRLVDRGVGTKFEIETNIQSQLAQGKVSISEERLEASITHNRIEGMFANAGMSVDTAAKEINTSVDALYDKSNWNDGVFTDPKTGKSYKFEFNYEGNVFEEINE